MYSSACALSSSSQQTSLRQQSVHTCVIVLGSYAHGMCTIIAYGCRAGAYSEQGVIWQRGPLEEVACLCTNQPADCQVMQA